MTREPFAAALAAEFAAAEPLPGNAFKVPLAQNLGLAVLCELAGIADDADGFADLGLPGADGPAGRSEGSDGS